jgi:hypothetical protein
MVESLCGMPGAGPAQKFDAARLFLADLPVEADLFANPQRAQEWLITIENLHHALMSLEQQYGELAGPATLPNWFARGSLGRFFAKFMEVATELPVGDLERLDPSCKLAMHGALVGALVLACHDINTSIAGQAGE